MSGVGLKCQHQARHLKIVVGWSDVMLAAFAADFFDATTPRFDVARTEESIGQKGIGRV